MAELDTILTLEKFTAIKSKANFGNLEKKLKLFWPLWETFAANPATATDDTVQKLKKALLAVTDEAGTLVETFTKENRAKKPEYAYVVGVQMKATKLRTEVDKIVKEAVQAESLRKLKEQELARIDKEAAKPTDPKTAAQNQQAAALRKLKDEELARIDKEVDPKEKAKKDAEQAKLLREQLAQKVGSLPEPSPNTDTWTFYVKLAKKAGLKVEAMATGLAAFNPKVKEMQNLIRDMDARLPKVQLAWMDGDASKQGEIDQFKQDQQKLLALGKVLSPVAKKYEDICSALFNQYKADNQLAELVNGLYRTAAAIEMTVEPGKPTSFFAIDFNKPSPRRSSPEGSGAWGANRRNGAARANDPYNTDPTAEDPYNSERETEKAYN